MNQGIYKIINVVNDCFYIGSAVNLKRRHTRHFSELRNSKHSNPRLQAAWNKYGEAAFVFTILELVPNKEDLYTAEDRWLKQHVGKQYCYNLGMAAISPMLGLTGEKSPTWGYKHTDAAKAKIAAAGKGRRPSAETLAKRSAKLKGRVISAAQRVQISQTLSGEGNYWYSKKRPEHGKKVSKMVFAMPDGILFRSLQQCLAYYEIKMPTLRRALVSGEPIKRGKMMGHSFKYCGIANQTDLDKHLIAKKLGNC